MVGMASPATLNRASSDSTYARVVEVDLRTRVVEFDGWLYYNTRRGRSHCILVQSDPGCRVRFRCVVCRYFGSKKWRADLVEVFGADSNVLRSDYSTFSSYVLEQLHRLLDVPVSTMSVAGVISLLPGSIHDD